MNLPLVPWRVGAQHRILFRVVLVWILFAPMVACSDRQASDAIQEQGAVPAAVEHLPNAQKPYFEPWATAKDLRLDVGWSEARPHGQLTYRAFVQDINLTPLYFVDQPFTLNGHLLAYWETQFTEADRTKLIDAEPEKTLRLRFYPQGAQMDSLLEDLAALVEDDRKARRFFIYESFDEDPTTGIKEGVSEDHKLEIEVLLKPFGSLATKLKKDQEGYIAIPVTATLVDVLGFHESASTFVYGKLSDVKPWPQGAALVKDIPDFSDNEYLGKPWQQMFDLDPTAVAYEHPDETARVAGPARGDFVTVEKISAHNADWFLVRFSGDPYGKHVYVRVKDLWIVN